MEQQKLNNAIKIMEAIMFCITINKDHAIRLGMIHRITTIADICLASWKRRILFRKEY